MYSSDLVESENLDVGAKSLESYGTFIFKGNLRISCGEARKVQYGIREIIIIYWHYCKVKARKMMVRYFEVK